MQQQVTLEPGQSQQVSFGIIPQASGLYSVVLDGLQGSFMVNGGQGQWKSPDDYSDVDEKWYFEELAYDGNINTEAWTMTPGAWLWLILFTSGSEPPPVSKVRVYCGTEVGNIYQDADIAVRVFDDDECNYVDVFSGLVPKLQWVELALDKIRHVYDIDISWNSIPSGGSGCLFELQYWEV